MTKSIKLAKGEKLKSIDGRYCKEYINRLTIKTTKN